MSEAEKLDIEELKAKLNKLYDQVEDIDKQINILILKRNFLLKQIETGVAILILKEK